jgi:hypothetical protein
MKAVFLYRGTTEANWLHQARRRSMKCDAVIGCVLHARELASNWAGALLCRTIT